jgi:hypothetical protein
MMTTGPETPSLATFVYSKLEVEAAGYTLQHCTLGNRVLAMCNQEEVQEAFQAEIDQPVQPAIIDPTFRQLRIMVHISCGLTLSQAAENVGVTKPTADRDFAQVRNATGSHNREETYRRLFERDLISPLAGHTLLIPPKKRARTILAAGLLSRGWTPPLLTRAYPDWLNFENDLGQMRLHTESTAGVQAVSKLFGASLLLPDATLRQRAQDLQK